MNIHRQIGMCFALAVALSACAADEVRSSVAVTDLGGRVGERMAACYERAVKKTAGSTWDDRSRYRVWLTGEGSFSTGLFEGRK